MFLPSFPIASSQDVHHIKVTITTNITTQLLCTNQSVLLTCHTDDVIDPSYQWTSSVDQLNWTNSDILVTATDHVINCTCTVTSSDDREGDPVMSNGKGNTVVS